MSSCEALFHQENGGVGFVPESDVLQYALLKPQDEGSRQRALKKAFINNLTLAHCVLPAMNLTQAIG
jgi:hypothetical protein